MEQQDAFVCALQGRLLRGMLRVLVGGSPPSGVDRVALLCWGGAASAAWAGCLVRQLLLLFRRAGTPPLPWRAATCCAQVARHPPTPTTARTTAGLPPPCIELVSHEPVLPPAASLLGAFIAAGAVRPRRFVELHRRHAADAEDSAPLASPRPAKRLRSTPSAMPAYALLVSNGFFSCLDGWMSGGSAGGAAATAECVRLLLCEYGRAQSLLLAAEGPPRWRQVAGWRRLLRTH